MTDLETLEERPWYEERGHVTFVAEYLASLDGTDPRVIISVYESPWHHTADYEAALEATVDNLIP